MYLQGKIRSAVSFSLGSLGHLGFVCSLFLHCCGIGTALQAQCAPCATLASLACSHTQVSILQGDCLPLCCRVTFVFSSPEALWSLKITDPRLPQGAQLPPLFSRGTDIRHKEPSSFCFWCAQDFTAASAGILLVPEGTGTLWGSLFEVEASQVTPKAKGSLNYGNPQLQKYERKTWRSSAAKGQKSWKFPSAKQSPQCPSCLCFPPRPKAHSDAVSHGAGMGDSWGDFHFSLREIPMLPSHQFRCCIVHTINYKKDLNKHLF